MEGFFDCGKRGILASQEGLPVTIEDAEELLEGSFVFRRKFGRAQ